MHITRIYSDGGSRGNPGPAAAGLVAKNDQDQTAFQAGYYLGEKTNNEAEYLAVLLGLKTVLSQSQLKLAAQLDWYVDSKLVAKQLSGEYKIKAANLRPLIQEITRLTDRTSTKIRFKHLKREFNHEADAVLNTVLDSIHS